MASDAEPAKLLLPFLQRADELQKHEPLVAYYCRLYAMERGLKIPQKERTKTTNALLTSLMNQLEKDKRALKLSTEDYLYLEGFATNVFAKADKQDRAGRADLNTAKTFYAASIFYEILNQFGELPPDIEQKLKYAVWKAADIRRALKEGRKPEVGPPGGDKDLLDQVPDSNESSQSDLPTTPTPDHTEQHELARRKSFIYSAPTVPSQPGDKDPRNENINYAGETLSSPPTDKNQLDPYANLHAHNSPSYPSTDYQHLPQAYPQNYSNSYSYEQQAMPHNLPPESQPPSYSYPNFQSYPSFQESSFPAAPTHPPAAPTHPNYQSASHYGAPDDHGSRVGSAAMPADRYGYDFDGNYQPPVEKIAEAHKAARFAVGALAFDDVPVAVDFLRRSLELLTNPSAETH